MNLIKDLYNSFIWWINIIYILVIHSIPPLLFILSILIGYFMYKVCQERKKQREEKTYFYSSESDSEITICE